MQPDRPIEEYESTATWRKGLCEQWGGDPLAEDPERLRNLAAFCAFSGKDPDELVAFCFLRRKATAERFASVKRRQAIAQQLRAFRAESGCSGPEARRLVSDVLSFLIHNGVMMNPGMV